MTLTTCCAGVTRICADIDSNPHKKIVPHYLNRVPSLEAIRFFNRQLLLSSSYLDSSIVHKPDISTKINLLDPCSNEIANIVFFDICKDQLKLISILVNFA